MLNMTRNKKVDEIINRLYVNAPNAFICDRDRIIRVVYFNENVIKIEKIDIDSTGLLK